MRPPGGFGSGSGRGGFFGGSSSSGTQSGGFGGSGGSFAPGGNTSDPNFRGAGGGLGTAASFDLRLREVEKKLQSLIEDMKALRKDQPTEKAPPRKE